MLPQTEIDCGCGPDKTWIIQFIKYQLDYAFFCNKVYKEKYIKNQQPAAVTTIKIKTTTASGNRNTLEREWNKIHDPLYKTLFLSSMTHFIICSNDCSRERPTKTETEGLRLRALLYLSDRRGPNRTYVLFTQLVC